MIRQAGNSSTRDSRMKQRMSEVVTGVELQRWVNQGFLKKSPKNPCPAAGFGGQIKGPAKLAMNRAILASALHRCNGPRKLSETSIMARGSPSRVPPFLLGGQL